MLFGCRPFGEGQSQEKVLHENTMLRATHVNFPPKPPVSNDAKVRACVHAYMSMASSSGWRPSNS